MCTRPKSLQNDILSEDPIVTLMMDLGLKKEGTTLKKFWLSEKKVWHTVPYRLRSNARNF